MPREVDYFVKLSKPFLNIPVKTGGPMRYVKLIVDGQIVRQAHIEITDEEPDFWVTMDVGPWLGKEGTLEVDGPPDACRALEAVEPGDRLKDAEDLYREVMRPQFHFTAQRGWINDPNGLVFHKGEYHLYFQHNPYGWHGSDKHWGHAVSADLVHWEELAEAIHPRADGDHVWSGSAAMDWGDTGGFKTGEEDVLVAAFTSTGRGECIVYSNDRGRTFTESPANPVIIHRGRDPRLVWHEPTKQWVMALYHETGEGEGRSRNIAFYTSPDLRAWEYQSMIAGYYECPDLFPLALDGDPNQVKWILTAASSEYAVGHFDGKRFTPETPKLPGHRGNAFYAAQTFSDIPAHDGRRIQIGWGTVALPGMPFNQMMMFPCELTLHSTPEGPRMHWWPVREIEGLRVAAHRLSGVTVTPGCPARLRPASELLDISVEFAPGTAATCVVDVHGIAATYDVGAEELACGNRTASLAPKHGKVGLRILVDRPSVEVFAAAGAVYMPMAATGQDHKRGVSVLATGGEAVVHSLEVHELRSVWK
jgi:fructan beta-fructosidase